MNKCTTETKPKSYILSEWGMLTKPILIFIAGKSGTGKDTVSDLLYRYFKDDNKSFVVRIYSFATELKSIAYNIGWDGFKFDKGRKLLQDIGTIGRSYDPDLWAKKEYSRFEREPISPDIIIFNDWRYLNELEFFKSQKDIGVIFTIRVVAPNREFLDGTKESTHESECALDNYLGFDYIVDNSGEMGETKIQCEIISEKIIKSLGG